MVNWSSPAVKRQLPSGWVVSMVPVTRSTFTWPSRSSRSLPLLGGEGERLTAVQAGGDALGGAQSGGRDGGGLVAGEPSSKRTAPHQKDDHHQALGAVVFQVLLGQPGVEGLDLRTFHGCTQSLRDPGGFLVLDGLFGFHGIASPYRVFFLSIACRRPFCEQIFNSCNFCYFFAAVALQASQNSL